MADGGKELPRSYLAKQCKEDLNKLCQIQKTPGPGEGAQLDFMSELPSVIKTKVGNFLSLYKLFYLNMSRGGTPLYKDFDNYGLKSGRVFGAGNIYESLQTYFSSQYVTGTTN